MPDTQVERISQLDIGDGKLYEFAGANNGMVFNNVTAALAAIQAGTVANGDVFYIKNDGTSGYPVFIGTSAQITTADNAGKIPAGMLIYCTDDSVNDITALQVSYGNTTVKAKLDDIIDGLGDTDISDIGDGTVTGAVSQVNSDLSVKPVSMGYTNVNGYENVNNFIIEFAGTNLGSVGSSYTTLLTVPIKPKHDLTFMVLSGSTIIDIYIGATSGNLQVKSHDNNAHTISQLFAEIRYLKQISI